MPITSPEGNYPPPPPPPPADNGGSTSSGDGTGGGGVQQPNIGPLAPIAGQVVRDQQGRSGKYSRGLRSFKYTLTTAKLAIAPKEEQAPGTAIQILVAQGGLIPDDARISVGGSDYFPLLDGWVYETEEPFDGFALYWPTAAPGVDVWILVAYGRVTQIARR